MNIYYQGLGLLILRGRGVALTEPSQQNTLARIRPTEEPHAGDLQLDRGGLDGVQDVQALFSSASLALSLKHEYELRHKHDDIFM